MTLAVHILGLLLSVLPPDVEIAAFATLRGVPVTWAIAVSDVETGALRDRDNTVSQGNIGRFQIRASTWCPVLHLPRPECIRYLQNRHANIRTGVAILAYIRDRHASMPWTAVVARYNDGIKPGPDGERYAFKVASKVRRMERERRRFVESRGVGW